MLHKIKSTKVMLLRDNSNYRVQINFVPSLLGLIFHCEPYSESYILNRNSNQQNNCFVEMENCRLIVATPDEKALVEQLVNEFKG